MKTMTVAKLKAQFSSVLDDVRNGEEVVIEYGKSHEKLGVIVPYEKYKPQKRKLGVLEHKAEYKVGKKFNITDEELLSS